MVDVSRWDGLVVEGAVEGGHRNEVYRGTLGERAVSIRRSRRSPASLRWELELIMRLAGEGLRVAEVIGTDDGALSADGWVVQEWLDGQPPESSQDWHAVARTLGSLHQLTVDYPQRPECCTVLELATLRRSADADLDQVPADVEEAVTEVFASFGGVPTAVVHGDPMAGNIRIGADGSVGLLDFDESRVDLVWHDLANLDVQVLTDPEHARAQQLSHAWEAVNGWIVEPDYARSRLAQLEPPTT